MIIDSIVATPASMTKNVCIISRINKPVTNIRFCVLSSIKQIQLDHWKEKRFFTHHQKKMTCGGNSQARNGVN